MRSKLNDLMIYHPGLDAKETVELLKAFERGDLALVAERLDPGNVNSPIGAFGFLPLELAIIYDHRRLFDHLVYGLNADVNAKNRLCESLPFVALAFQRRHFLFELLDIDVSTLYDCTHDTQRTLVHEAAICGDAETVERLLLEFGFYKNLNEFELGHLLYDVYGCSPLYYACWKGYVDIVEILLECCDHESRPPRMLSDAEDDDDDDEAFAPASDELDAGLAPVRFQDGSLAISILYKRLDCAKLLLATPLAYSFVSTGSGVGAGHKEGLVYISELDAWFSACLSLQDHAEFADMCNLFHELVLNGAKFSPYVFSVIDSIPGLKQFQVEAANSSNGDGFHLSFSYSSHASFFMRSLAFLCAYNLTGLFDGPDRCQLFLKSCFVVIHKLFLSQPLAWLDSSYLRSRALDLDSPAAAKHSGPHLFLADLRRFAQCLYINGHSLRLLANFSYLDGLRKNVVLHQLLRRWLYSYAKEKQRESTVVVSGMNPLRLADLCSLKIKQSIAYLDAACMTRLQIPKDTIAKLTASLATGLETSQGRRQMLRRLADLPL